jgi:hypothetical protein
MVRTLHIRVPVGKYLAVLWLTLGCCLEGRAQALQAGAARIDITPPIGFAMWGYGARHDNPCQGVLDPLEARAVVLAAGKERVALVSLDLGRAPTRTSTAAIRRQVQAISGITTVFLVGTHTHHGPVVELDQWPSPRDSYVRALEKKVAQVIETAAGRLRPARLGVAAREVGLNRNRHSRRADKPVDRELLVVRIEGADGTPIAHVVNFAAHATLREVKLFKFSADFPGVLARQVEQQTGAPCLYLQGAAGDLSANPSGERTAEAFGRELANEVLSLAKSVRCNLTEGSLVCREEEFRFGKRVDLGNPFIKAAFAAAFFPALVDFYEREYREGIRPHLTVALLGGRIGLVGVSGEFFCGHSLSLKRRARLEHLLFLGYCNDYQQYFPTIGAVAEGGYGADPDVAPVEVGAGERIMDRALMHLYALRGLLKH